VEGGNRTTKRERVKGKRRVTFQSVEKERERGTRCHKRTDKGRFGGYKKDEPSNSWGEVGGPMSNWGRKRITKRAPREKKEGGLLKSRFWKSKERGRRRPVKVADQGSRKKERGKRGAVGGKRLTGRLEDRNGVATAKKRISRRT